MTAGSTYVDAIGALAPREEDDEASLVLMSLSCLVGAAVTAQVTVNRNPRPRKVAEIYNEGSISRDGRFFGYWNWDAFDDNLFVRDLRTGKDTQLTDKSREPGEVSESSVISPDNKHVAYAWFADDGAVDLRTANGAAADAGRCTTRAQETRTEHTAPS